MESLINICMESEKKSFNDGTVCKIIATEQEKYTSESVLGYYKRTIKNVVKFDSEKCGCKYTVKTTLI